LSFEPQSDWICESFNELDLATLGLQAQALFDGQTDEVLMALIAAGSSGGARPKAQIYFRDSQPEICRTYALPGDQAWLVKFTSQNLALGHEEGLCEAVYLQMAAHCGLQPPTWRLFDAPEQSGARAWLGVKRFDWLNHGSDRATGRLHLHSACGLLDADFRTPSLDYIDLIKASRQLCKSPCVGQLQFKRALFNLFASNQDDHSKNWAFLQDDQAQWLPSPFYDVTYSPHPFNEHATAFGGYGKQPPLKLIQALASHAGFECWKQAQQAIVEIVDNLASFKTLANALDIQNNTITAIERTLSQRREENKHLLGR
jgi:serine/threonine-protein kinase HipA